MSVLNIFQNLDIGRNLFDAAKNNNAQKIQYEPCLDYFNSHVKAGSGVLNALLSSVTHFMKNRSQNRLKT